MSLGVAALSGSLGSIGFLAEHKFSRKKTNKKHEFAGTHRHASPPSAGAASIHVCFILS